MIIIVTIAFLGIGFAQGRSLWQQKNYWEFTVFLFFMVMAYVFSFLQMKGVEIPSPLPPVKDLFTKLGIL